LLLDICNLSQFMNIKIPVSWLRDYLKTDAAAKTIANHLNACGPSIERMEKVAEDYIFNIEVTSNRPDAFSVFGIAREANAILKSKGQKSIIISPKGITTSLEPDTPYKVKLDAQVTNPKLCPHFAAIILEVKVHESPALIKNRLKASGIRPINNIVDITNYIMLELGQPMHAFDFDKIQGSKMLLREARNGEKLTTLDGIRRNLTQGTIVIQDQKRLIDLCGIMGGENSQITRRTKRVVFFAQAYNPVNIRKTTQSLSIRTDAAIRFEKGLDLENILPALSRAVCLAKEIANAKIVSELIDIYPNKQKTLQIKLSFEKLYKYLGITLDKDKVVLILKYLGFTTSLTENILTAQAPTWRANDIETDVDLIEEIARLYGYHNLPSALPAGEIPNRQNSILKDVINLKKALKNLGLTETITYSIISKNTLKITGFQEKNAIELENPLTEEWQFMRPTILTSLLDVIAKNKYLDDKIKIFEIAKTYLPAKTSANKRNKHQSEIPRQNLKIAFALQNSSFLEIKGLIENLFEILNRNPKFEKSKEDFALVEKSQSAIVKIGDGIMGTFGLITPEATQHFGLEANVALAELNLTDIYSSPQVVKSYHPIPKFPPQIEDISAIFATAAPVAEIIDTVKKASTMAKKVEAIDIFEDPKLGENKKSVTIHIVYQKHTGTPTQQEVALARKNIIASLEKEFRAKIRK